MVVVAASEAGALPDEGVCGAGAVDPGEADVLVVAVWEVRCNHEDIIERDVWPVWDLGDGGQQVGHVVVGVTVEAMEEQNDALDVGGGKATAGGVERGVVCKGDVFAVGIFHVPKGDFTAADGGEGVVDVAAGILLCRDEGQESQGENE